ncbi:MAG TPA: protein kinase [Vicinamibacterales bacterium]|jgi:transcriptional regulator with GAF, ATPase, and Fis domain|nr:protein kinase [Vicinamibacterales bacterium]
MPDRRTPEQQSAQRAAEFHILQRTSGAINSTLNLEEIYDTALRTMDELFAFHHSVILLVEPGARSLRVVASRGYENQAIGGRVPFGVGAIGIVAEKRKLLHLGNLGAQRTYASAQRRQMLKSDRAGEVRDTIPVPGLPNAESQIAIPLLIGDELVGVFSIESPVRKNFDEHERELASIVANQIASAIRNAQLYEETRRSAEALQAANETLEARVAERTAELERELRIADELLNDARNRVEGPLLGDSQAVRGLRDAVAREAKSVEPLLLVGPPGAGKEAFAYALHAASGRPGAFIFVSCPELHTPMPSGDPGCGETLLAAKADLANNGTLFLEAVHELPSAMRDALAKLIDQQMQARRRGDAPVPDVRIIASTIVDPHSIRDLMPDRLRTNRIAIPALADRREDVPAIVDHFVQRQARRLGKTITGVSPEALQRLQQYPWPGNIRELQGVLERAILVSRSAVLDIDEDLLDERLAVGSYRLVSQLGSGGMGEVWLGRHRLLLRPAAVKLIRHDAQTGGARDQLVRRFQREAQVTAGLRSPHTVQLYDFGVNDSGSFYYVMELLDGLDLQRLVSRFGPQPAERVVLLLRQACRSLAEAHELGLVHRDIKPANLFVARMGSEYDFLKILDFGIVKDQPGADSTIISAQGILQGTPAFIAPEVVFGDRPVDGRADLYSLACTAYWALTGQLLFRANTPAQMLLHHAQTIPTPPSQISELPIPKELDAILMKCLEKDPDQRPRTALELHSMLAGVKAAEWTQANAREWWEAHAPELIR